MDRKSFEKYLKERNDKAITQVVIDFIDAMFNKACELSDNLPMHSKDFEKLLAGELIVLPGRSEIYVHGYMDDRVEVIVRLYDSFREICDDLTVDDIFGETDYFNEAYKHCVEVYKLQLEDKMQQYEKFYKRVCGLIDKESFI